MYDREIFAIHEAISALRSERSPLLIAELENEQRAAGTSLEWYGITKSVFERFLTSKPLSERTVASLNDAVHAVKTMYGSAAK